MLAGAVQLDQVRLLAGVSLGCLPRSRPLALATLMPSRVRIRIRSASNSATMASTLNSSRPTGSVGSCTRAAEAELDLAAGQLVGDVARVGQRPREPVELSDYQRVAAARHAASASPQPRPVAIRAGQAVVDVDAVRLDAEGA